MEEFPLGKALSGLTWERLPGPHPFSAESLRETLLGGQAFRWFSYAPEAAYIGVWEQRVAALRLGGDGLLEFAAVNGALGPREVRAYLALERHEAWARMLPISSDPVVARLARHWMGVVILRQPAWETLLGFICSANKQIPHIRGMLEALARQFGTAIAGTPFHSLPGYEALAAATEAELRACQLGYRAPYVRACAQRLVASPGLLEEIALLPTPQARERLMALPGVGPKVADCMLLFGFGRGEAFPVDTWIDRALREAYPELAGWNRAQLATFARIHFGPAGGLVQQWFFAQARSQAAKR